MKLTVYTVCRGIAHRHIFSQNELTKKRKKYFVDLKLFLLLQDLYNVSLGGGTGRRAGFKIQFFRKCGFDSRLEYILKPQLFNYK